MKLLSKIAICASFVLALHSNLTALNFKPLVANPIEPRVGGIYEFADEKLRLDIGTSLDLAKFKMGDKTVLSVGTDFFTYTRLRTAGNFKFPVETSDYYFGLNSCYVDSSFKYPLSFRMRVAHISSHLVDGYADSVTFKKEPFVYSREFIDLVAAINIDDFRFYAGVNMLYSTKPKDFLFLHPQIGFDYNYKLSNSVDLIAGYDFKYAGIHSAMHPVHSMQAGFKFNTSDDVAVFLGVYGYKGKSLHGLFYNENDDYLGTGFQIMF